MKYNSILSIILIFALPGTIISAKDISPSEAYIELIIFKSKTKSTNLYGQKVDNLIASKIELWDDPYLNERMNSLSSSKNNMAADGLKMLGFLPGRFGALGKATKLLDYGSNFLNENFKNSSNTIFLQSWELKLREKIEILFSFADKDKSFKDNVNKYMSSEFGDIDGTSEEIINMYPPFKNHQNIKDLLKRSADVDNVKEEIFNIRKDIQLLLQEKKAQIEFNTLQRKIEEYNTYGRLAIKVLGDSNPELTAQLSSILGASTRGASVYNMYSNNKISTSLASANYLLIAFELFESGMSDSNANEAILKEILKVQKMIAEQNDMITLQFRGIGEYMQTIHSSIITANINIIENRNSLIFNTRRIQDLEDKILLTKQFLSSSIKAGFNRTLVECVSDVQNRQKIVSAKSPLINQEKFIELYKCLYNYAVIHSEDDLSVNIINRDYSEDGIYDELNMVNRILDISYLQKVYSNSGGDFSTINMDPMIWLFASKGIEELLVDWPEFQLLIDAASINEIIDKGEALANFFTECKYSNNPVLYFQYRESILGYNVKIAELFSKYTIDRFVTDFKKNNKISLSLEQGSINHISSVSQFIELLDNSSVVKIPVSYSSITERKNMNDVLDIPNFIKKDYISSKLKMLHHLGIINFKAKYEYISTHIDVKEFKWHLVIYAVDNNTNEEIEVLKFLEHRGPAKVTGMKIAIAYDGIANYTPPPLQVQFNHGVEQRFKKFKDRYLANLTSNVIMIENKYQNEINSYLHHFVNETRDNYFNNLEEGYKLDKARDGKYETLLSLISFGHSSMIDTSNKLNDLFYGHAKVSRTTFDNILLSVSIDSVFNSSKEWDKECKLFYSNLINDKSKTGLILDHFTEILNSLKFIKNGIEKGQIVKSTKAINRVFLSNDDKTNWFLWVILILGIGLLVMLLKSDITRRSQ